MNRKFLALVAMAALLGAAPACLMLWDDWSREVEMASFQKVQPRAGEESLQAEVTLGVGRLQVEPGPAELVYDLDLEYDKGAFKPEVEYDVSGRTGHLRVHLESIRSARHLGKTRLDLRLNPELPLRFRGKTGVGENQFDLGGLSLERFTLKSGVGETKISMLEANRALCRDLRITSGVGDFQLTGLGNFAFQDFHFKGGVGHSRIDFSGEWKDPGQIEIEVGVGGLEILLPRSLGAEIEISKSFLSGVSFPGFRREGDRYRSENMDEVSRVVHIRIRAGIGGVRLRWI